MKLIIQIPCFNEGGTLAIALNALPRHVEGFDSVEWLIIDDGSLDNTIEVAKKSGVDHIIRHKTNKGLAYAFMTGIDACLKFGADVIVNTDADNQYNADDIPKLVAPILAQQAEFVVGERPIQAIEHFSPLKKLLKSWEVGLCGQPVTQIFLMRQVVFVQLIAKQLKNSSFSVIILTPLKPLSRPVKKISRLLPFL